MNAPPPVSPERLARLLDEAVSQVTAPPGTFDRIRHGIRRRRWRRRIGAALFSAALLAGGSVTVLTVTPGGSWPGRRPLPRRRSQPPLGRRTRRPRPLPGGQRGMRLRPAG